MPKCLLLQSRDANILSSIVFAAANECGYNLIELGPDTKRSGADLISELAESTKSHSIHHGQAKKISLIFLSQVDVLYEQDQGFWNALLSIVLNSRRLIIMSCSGMISVVKL
jgi:hypothetical protein